jgi:hypothetical protein
MRLLQLLSVLTSYLACITIAISDDIALDRYGNISICNKYKLLWKHAGPQWVSNKNLNRTTAILKKSDENKTTSTIEGTFVIKKDQQFEYKIDLVNNEPGEYAYTANFSANPAVPTQMLCFTMEVSTSDSFKAVINGENITMPEKYEKLGVFSEKNAKSFCFQIHDKQICIKGKFSIYIQDNRQYKRESFAIRIFPENNKGELKSSNISLNISVKKLSDILISTPVDITASVNMGFADEVAMDGKGGWTDQGSKNDLYSMPLGMQNFGGIEFNIINPEKNNGKSCIIIADPNTRNFPPYKSVAIKETGKQKYIYLLHGAAYVPKFKETIGTLVVNYATGNKTEYPILNGIDCGNWWRPTMSYPNGILWRGENRGGEIGLFISAFKLEENQKVESLNFIPGTGIWMIAGISFCNIKLDAPIEKEYLITEGQDWTPIEVSLEIEAGSVMDFSDASTAPAGKFGRVIINKTGHFSFEDKPSELIRFLGTNLCQSALIPSHKDAERLAKTLAARGYNSVRLHQYESAIIDWTSNDSLHFNKENLDRFQYLMAKLKEAGLYMCLDVYATRHIRPGDNIVECKQSKNSKARKILNSISPSAMENWKEYALRLWKIKNPYTGMTIAEDPAFYSTNIDNESSLIHQWNQVPELIGAVEQAYTNWLKEKGNYSAENAKNRKTLFNSFLKEKQMKSQAEQIKFLREELGTKILITNLNDRVKETVLLPLRQKLDHLDVHMYHDHPIYPQKRWSLPVGYKQKSDISNLAFTLHSGYARFINKPFTVTEINYCPPNIYRSESGGLIGACAALQDWDGIYRFAFTHDRKRLGEECDNPGVKGFDSIYDPISTIADRIIYFLFLRGDVATAKETIVIEWDDLNLDDFKNIPEDFRYLQFYKKIGLVNSKEKKGTENRIQPGEHWETFLSESDRKVLDEIKKTSVVRSCTGQIELDAKKETLKVVTPKSEVFTFKGKECSGDFMQISNAGNHQTISIHALDNMPLKESNDMLLFHLTNAANNKMKFSSKDSRILLDNGDLPILMRKGMADIHLSIKNDGNIKIIPIAINGKEYREDVKFTQTQDGINFHIDTEKSGNACIVYRIRIRN